MFRIKICIKFINSPGKLDRKKAALANKYEQAGNNFNRHPK